MTLDIYYRGSPHWYDYIGDTLTEIHSTDSPVVVGMVAFGSSFRAAERALAEEHPLEVEIVTA